MSGAGVIAFAPIGIDGPRAPDRAPAETEAAIVRLVVQRYPTCSGQLEAAARMALQLGWAAALAMEAQQ